MNRTPPKKAAAKEDGTRDDRLKAALKANLARRKAQAKVRASGPAAGDKKES